MLLSACDQPKTTETFTFTAISDQDETKPVKRFSAVADYLELI